MGLPPGTSTFQLSDNSGYTLYRTGGVSFIVFTGYGAYFSVPSTVGSAGYGSATFTDTNGNQISAAASSSSATFTDTMGKTVLSASGAAPNDVIYSYTDPNGTAQTVTVKYGLYTVQSNFPVSGIQAYSQSNVPLVNSIVYSADASSYSFTYEQIPNSSAVTGRLASITLRTGGTISYTYTGGYNGMNSDGTTSGLVRTTSDGQTTYTRSGNTTVRTDANGNQTQYTFLNSGTTYYETDRASYTGSVGGTLLQEVKTCYNDQTSGCPNNSVSSAISFLSATAYQNGINVSTQKQWYSGPELLTQTQDVITGLTTQYAYNTYTGPYNIPFYRVASQVSTLGSSTVAQTTYGYDEGTPTPTSGLPQHVAVSTTRGNLTSQHAYTDSSIYDTIDSYFTYDDAGTVLTSSQTGKGVTRYGYDSTDALLTSIALPTPASGVAMTTTIGYNSSNLYTGLPSTVTDPNGATQTLTYDGMLRVLESDVSDASGHLVGRTSYTYSTPTAYGVYAYQNSSAYTDSEYVLDAYGRQIHSAISNGQSGSGWDLHDTCYDAVGNVNFQSYNYQGTGVPSSPVCTNYGDHYTRDAIGRVTKLTHADSSSYISYAYNGRAVQTTDENGVSRISQAYGTNSSVCEISATNNMPGSGSSGSCGMDISGTGFLTNYTTDLANHKLTVTQGAQTRLFQQDWSGRAILVQEPEAGQTTYSYSYTTNGLVVTRQRPKANQTNASTLTTTTTQYDLLGRPLSVSYSDGTPTKTFSYDSATAFGISTGSSKGQLVSASFSTGVAEAFSYDPEGRVSQTYQVLPSGAGKTGSYLYDWVGNLISSTDAAGVTTSYTYTRHNKVQSVSSSLNDSTHPGSLISNVQYGPFGPTGYQLGNGLTAVRFNDPYGNTGAWLCLGSTQQYCAGGTQIYAYTTTHRGSRTATTCDTVTGCFSYGYDEFNRLTAVNAGSQQAFTFVYDRWGNRWLQNALLGGYSPQYSFNTANNQITGFTYDAAGNLINDTVHTYAYDAEGNQTLVDGGTTAQYTYDALNQRVRIDQAGSGQEFTFDPSGKRTSIWSPTAGQIQGHSYWGASPIYFYSGGIGHFQHQDWLGTERARTKYDGSLEGTFSSAPFGDSLGVAGSDNDQYHFAQLDHDLSNIDHAQYRQYGNVQGRWFSPDPFSGSYDFSNPQSLNRYAYVLNNPSSLTDPSGMLVQACGGTDNGNCPIYGTGSGPTGGCTVDGLPCSTVLGFGSGLGSNMISGVTPVGCYGPVCSYNGILYTYGNGSSAWSACSGVVSTGTGFTIYCYVTEFQLAGVTTTLSNSAGSGTGSTWGGTFVSSFLTFAGGPGGVPTCAGQALNTVVNDVNPFPSNTNPSGTDWATAASQTVAKVTSMAFWSQAMSYAGSRGLTVPLRSSVFRGLVSTSAELGQLSEGATIPVIIGAGHSIYATSASARSGGCAAAFPVF